MAKTSNLVLRSIGYGEYGGGGLRAAKQSSRRAGSGPRRGGRRFADAAASGGPSLRSGANPSSEGPGGTTGLLRSARNDGGGRRAAPSLRAQRSNPAVAQVADRAAVGVDTLDAAASGAPSLRSGANPSSEGPGVAQGADRAAVGVDSLDAAASGAPSLRSGANPSSEGPGGTTGLLRSARNDGGARRAAPSLRSGANPSSEGPGGTTGLLRSARNDGGARRAPVSLRAQRSDPALAQGADRAAVGVDSLDAAASGAPSLRSGANPASEGPGVAQGADRAAVGVDSPTRPRVVRRRSGRARTHHPKGPAERLDCFALLAMTGVGAVPRRHCERSEAIQPSRTGSGPRRGGRRFRSMRPRVVRRRCRSRARTRQDPKGPASHMWSGPRRGGRQSWRSDAAASGAPSAPVGREPGVRRARRGSDVWIASLCSQ